MSALHSTIGGVVVGVFLLGLLLGNVFSGTGPHRFATPEFWRNVFGWIRHRDTNRITAFSTLLLALATVILAGVAYCTDETTRKALVATNRAWVVPAGLSLGVMPTEAQAAVSGSLFLRNTGHEPAINVDIDKDVFSIGVTDKNLLANETAYAEQCRTKRPAGEEAVVFYPSTIGMNDYRVTIEAKPEVIDWDVVFGTKYLLFRGCLSYETFGSRHQSAFCYWAQAGKSGPGYLNLCSRGNEAD